MDQNNYQPLMLQNQLCFPIYACSREIIKQYRPHLQAIDLTYTQYITMMVLWAEKNLNVKALGERLLLDSGTLTPVLKSLEAKGFIRRSRIQEDQRVLHVEVTPAGWALRELALPIPGRVAGCTGLNRMESDLLYQLLYKLLEQLQNSPEPGKEEVL